MTPDEILESGRKLLKSKGEDYTTNRESNQFENFEKSNLIASWFKDDDDKSFAVLIGTKLARLSALLSNDEKVPNNESIADTFIDAANYFALWGGYRTRKTQNTQVNPTRICSRCQQPITTSFVTYQSRFYHNDCYAWFMGQQVGLQNQSPTSDPYRPNQGLFEKGIRGFTDSSSDR